VWWGLKYIFIAKDMKEPKEYTYEKGKVLLEVLFTIVGAIPMVVLILVSYQNPILALLVALLPGVLLYFQIYTLRITYQFNKYDRGKKIIISEDRLTMTLIYKGNEIKVNSANIEKIEIYEQNSLGKFGTYNYIVIYTNVDQKLLITKFTIPLLIYDKILETYLRKKPRLYFKKTFNFIDEDKFVL
jgi:hypothetical protein